MTLCLHSLLFALPVALRVCDVASPLWRIYRADDLQQETHGLDGDMEDKVRANSTRWQKSSV